MYFVFNYDCGSNPSTPINLVLEQGGRVEQLGKLETKHIIENNRISGKKIFHEDYEGTKVFVKHQRKDS